MLYIWRSNIIPVAKHTRRKEIVSLKMYQKTKKIHKENTLNFEKKLWNLFKRYIWWGKAHSNIKKESNVRASFFLLFLVFNLNCRTRMRETRKRIRAKRKKWVKEIKKKEKRGKECMKLTWVEGAIASLYLCEAII